MRAHAAALAAALVFVCAAPDAARGQDRTSGALAGVVTDLASGDPLSGVTVVVTSPALKGQRDASTDARGFYKLTGLPPGEYLATFTYFGVTGRLRTRVRLNATAPGHFRMDLSDPGGTIYEVEDSGPSVDTFKTDRGVVMDADFLDKMPIIGRGFEAALGKAPGAQPDPLGYGQSGSSSIENRYAIDGVDTTGLQFGMLGSPLVRDFVEEVEVITGGYNAEYGRSTGAVVNVVTKSGSNDLHGRVFAYMTPGALTASRERAPTQASSIDAETNLAFDTDVGFDLGGPIVKDRIWFYVGFAPRLRREHIDRITKRRTDCRTVQEDGSLSGCDTDLADGVPDEDPDTGFLIYEDIDRQRLVEDTSTYQFVSKLSFAASPEHQGQISLIGTPVVGEAIGVAGAPAATRRDVAQISTDLAAKWTSKLNDNKTEIEGVLGWHRASFTSHSIDGAANDEPRINLYFGDLGTWSMLGYESAETAAGCNDSAAAGDPYPFIANCPDDGAGYRIGGPGGIADDLEQRYSARLGVTQRVEALGHHELKVGVDLEDNRVTTARHLSGDEYFDVYAPSQIVGQRWVQLAPPNTTEGRFDDACVDSVRESELACDFIGPTEVVGQTLNWSAYLRDSWQIVPNLTLNAGVRYEEQRLRFADDLQNTTDPFTLRALGKNAMTLRDMWAPRVGAVYDWTKEGRAKVFGHWGRFYESIPMDINERSFGGETYYRRTWDASQCGPVDPALGVPDPRSCDGDPALGAVLFGSGVLVAPGVKAQYLDETVFGVEYELLSDLVIGLAYQNRRLGRILEDVSTDNAETYILANPGELSREAEQDLLDRIAQTDDPEERDRLESELEQFRGIRVFQKPRRDYDALQLTATRQISRNFVVQGSYTFSRTRGNYPGLFSPDNGQLDPNISSQFDLLELLANRSGPLPQDRPHNVKLDGWYTFDFGERGALTSGLGLRALSGAPIEALGRHYLYGFGESFLLPRGAMGRTEIDYGVDVRLTYGKPLPRAMRLEVFTDVFNLTNHQAVFSVDEDYTLDSVNPIVGGAYEDLVWAKAQTTGGGEQSVPIGRNRNFGRATSRYAPLSARLGARLIF